VGCRSAGLGGLAAAGCQCGADTGHADSGTDRERARDQSAAGDRAFALGLFSGLLGRDVVRCAAERREDRGTHELLSNDDAPGQGREPGVDRYVRMLTLG
jgi:hypothetical protein